MSGNKARHHECRPCRGGEHINKSAHIVSYYSKCCPLPDWWSWRENSTRSHSELGRQSSQRPWYCGSSRGRVGRCQSCQGQHLGSADRESGTRSTPPPHSKSLARRNARGAFCCSRDPSGYTKAPLPLPASGAFAFGFTPAAGRLAARPGGMQTLLLLARVRSAGTRILTCAAASLVPDARRMRPGRRRRHRCCGICARVARKTWHRRRSCAIRNCP